MTFVLRVCAEERSSLRFEKSHNHFIQSDAIRVDHLNLIKSCAGAKSPRWRSRLNQDMEKYSMLGPGVLRPPEWKDEKPPPLDDIYRIQPTYFDCKIRMPNKLALSFEIFCRAPPFPFVPCTAFEVSIPPLTKRCTHSHCVLASEPPFPRVDAFYWHKRIPKP